MSDIKIDSLFEHFFSFREIFIIYMFMSTQRVSVRIVRIQFDSTIEEINSLIMFFL